MELSPFFVFRYGGSILHQYSDSSIVTLLDFKKSSRTGSALLQALIWGSKAGETG